MPPPLKRWLILLAYWLIQAAVLIAAGVFYYGSISSGEWDPMPISGFVEALADGEIVALIAWSIPTLTLLQFLLVLPIHLRTPARRRGKSVYLSLAAAGVLLSLVVVAFVAAITECIVVYDLVEPRGWSLLALGLGLLVSWSVFTPLLIRYARASDLPNPDLLTRVSRLVFAGTAIETAALIPIDVMIRRKSDCYCWSGSLVAMVLSGAVGLVAAGPAVFLPLMARRPLWLKRGLCLWCDYPRQGLDPTTPCPECGRAPAEAAT